MSRPLVSVIINNYNYARFLEFAMESALNQDYSPKEVLVVDDGSTDDSRDIIAKYKGFVTPILKPNSGQASALNAGVAASRGDILCLLDADDCFGPGKVKCVVDAFEKHGLNAKPMLVHHRLQITNAAGDHLDGQVIGKLHESPLNLYDYAKRYKAVPYKAAPTSGLSLNRNLAKRVFPLPEKGIFTAADDFVVKAASLIGELHSLPAILGCYRTHGRNLWFGSSGRQSPEFVKTLDEFLNQRLTENGLSPVIAFEDSMYSWGDLTVDRNWKRLSTQMVKLSLRQHDLHTAGYVFRTLRGAAVLNVKAVLAKAGLQQRVSQLLGRNQ